MRREKPWQMCGSSRWKSVGITQTDDGINCKLTENVPTQVLSHFIMNLLQIVHVSK